MISFSELCRFHPKQWQATERADRARFFLFGGSRGPGKSYWLRWYLLRALLSYFATGFRNVQVCLATEDYPSLQDRQIQWIKTEFPDWLGHLGKKQDRGLGFHLRDCYGGSSILLRNLDKKSKIGAGYAIGAIDELGLISKETWDYFRSSIRWPGIPDCRFIAASNPVPGWVRKYWIERRFPPEFEHIAKTFDFLAALPEDNPSLDASYWNMLLSQPDGIREAWVHGDWYSAAQGLVYSNWGKENIVAMDVAPDVPVELSIDDGYIDPRAILFVQRTGTQINVVDEIYESMMLEHEHIDAVIRLLADAPHFEQWRKDRRDFLPEICVCSHEAVHLRAMLRAANIAARNWFENMKVGDKTVPNARPTAIKMTRGLIRDGKGKRSVYVHPRCGHLIDELSMGYRLKKKADGEFSETPEEGSDHAVHALEGYVFSRCKAMARAYV